MSVPLLPFEGSELSSGGVCANVHPACPHIYNLGEQDKGTTDCIFFSPRTVPLSKSAPDASSGQVFGGNGEAFMERVGESSTFQFLRLLSNKGWLSRS